VTKVAILRQLDSRLVAVLTRRVVSDFGSETGAARRCQVRSDEVIGSQTMFVTSGDADQQRIRSLARLVRDEEAAGSNPATPTR
jgi:hypothetical protein